MLFVVCNDRTQRGNCSFCGSNLLECPSYTRNLETTVLYCCVYCYEADTYAVATLKGSLVSLPRHIPIVGR